MGFDNECILNIQSLAGEYFCPVCRLLVYPNEALQSQCTHLYCKPCLTYVVSTTRACPYDGYLVTEADSKPLIESNKSLAETIGKIAVHCLYHRSGCTWQGSLSDCTSHCSGCAFGNSPVVCNRCAIQIVHRQVQEHAQNCPGVQPQAQQPESGAETSVTGTAVTADQTQSTTQTAVVTSQSQPSQIASATAPGKDLNQQSVSSSQSQAVVQAAVPISEQWYQQQQQQYQQYYQQYPGYDPYQQHYQQYYPYQQATAPQFQQQQHVQAQAPPATGQLQPQVYMQPQPQLQPLPQPHSQAAVATRPQNQAQINLQQQVTLPAVPPQPQIHLQTYPPAQGQPHPQPQPYSQNQLHPQPHPQHLQMPQYQQPLPQPQTQQQIQSQVQAQQHPPSQSQSHSQVQPPGQPQHHPQQNQPLNANFQSQPQLPSANAVTGHHSYPQPNTDPQMQIGVPQPYPGLTQPQVPSNLQSQNPVQIQNPFPQQPPLMRPPHSHATVPGQQQPALLPSPGQVKNIPPSQQSIQPHFQQPVQPVQRPVMQPIQQTFPQQHYQLPLPVSSQLRPQGQSHLFPPQTYAYPQPPQNVPLAHGMQYAKSPNPVGRPSTPNQGVQSQPYSHYAGGVVRPMYPAENQQLTNQNNMLKTNNQMQLPSEQYSGASSTPTMTVRQGDHSLAQRDVEVPPHKPMKTGANDLNLGPDLAANAGEIKTEKSETDAKSKDFEHKFIVEDKVNQPTTTSEEPVQSTKMLENGEPMVKPIKKEDDPESTLRPSSKGKSVEVVAVDTKDTVNVGPEKMKDSATKEETVDGSQPKKPPLQAVERHEGYGGNLLKDAISGSNEGPQGVSTVSAQILGSPAQNVISRGIAPGSEVKLSHQYAVQEKSHPQVAGADQGRHQPLPSHYGPSTLPQRSGAPPLLQMPPPGPPHQAQGLGPSQTFLRPQIPALHPPGSIPDPSPHSSHAVAFRTSQVEPVGASSSGALPPRACDSHGGMMARATPHGPEMFPNQRPNYIDGRGFDPHFPGSLEQGAVAQPSGMHPNMNRMNGSIGFDSSSTIGSRDERLPLRDERFNPFPPGPDPHLFDRAEFENDLRHFPRPFADAEIIPKLGNLSSRPFDGEHHVGLKYDAGLKVDPGAASVPSRFLSPYNGNGANDAGERPGGRHEDAFGRIEPTRGNLDLFGPGPAYGRRHMDSLASRSPGREHPGVISRGFGGPGPDDIHGREIRRFGEPFGGSFPESRLSMLPSHLRRGEFEGLGSMAMADDLRNDLIGRDGFSSHLRRGEDKGNFYGHLHFGEPVGFGAHSRHARMREMGGPGSFDSFGRGDRPSHPHLGEPGFRSSFSLHGFPDDGGIYTGDFLFDKSRKRKPPSMGWCRICKVDCETVEGLDLHSQTREHQKMAMAMVVTIKQNAKKQKLTSGDKSSLGDASKTRNASSEAVGKKK